MLLIASGRMNSFLPCSNHVKLPWLLGIGFMAAIAPSAVPMTISSLSKGAGNLVVKVAHEKSVFYKSWFISGMMCKRLFPSMSYFQITKLPC